MTVFVNSHLLSEVELLCDRVAIMSRGQLAREGTIAELTEQRNVYVLGLADGQAFPADEIRAAGLSTSARPSRSGRSTLTDGQAIDAVVDLLRGRGLGLRHLIEKRQTLEDTFFQTVGADARRADGDGSGGPAMKLLAMLKDSLREAVDRKIFAAMLVLGGLLTLFVASISYRPITLEEELTAEAGQITFLAGMGPHSASEAEFRIENFRQTNDAPEAVARRLSIRLGVHSERLEQSPVRDANDPMVGATPPAK